MRIGILQTGHVRPQLRERTGDYSDMFQSLLAGRGFDFRVYNVVDMEFPVDVHEADGWLVTGSRHGAYDDLPFIAPLEEFIRNAYAEGVPLVGICFGHQIIAQALGGRVEKFAGGWSVGPARYTIDGRDVTLNSWHQDQVVEKPAEATIVGSSPFCANAAMVYGDRAFTVQAHPEFDAGFVSGLIDVSPPGVVPEELLNQAKAGLDMPLDRDILARRIVDFFKQPRP